jgi:anti-sigma factor RsiW
MGKGLTCREFVEFLADFLSDHLPAEQHSAFEAHLRACPDCAHYARSYATTVRLATLARRGETEVPGDVPQELVESILAIRARGL